MKTMFGLDIEFSLQPDIQMTRVGHPDSAIPQAVCVPCIT